MAPLESIYGLSEIESGRRLAAPQQLLPSGPMHLRRRYAKLSNMPGRRKIDWNKPIVVALISALLAGAFAVTTALIPVFGGSDGHSSGGAGPGTGGSEGSVLADVTVSWVPRSATELVAIVEGSAHSLPSGYDIYAIARPDGKLLVADKHAGPKAAGAIAPAATVARLSGWLVSEGVLPGKTGRWRAEIIVSSFSKTSFTVQAVEMALTPETELAHVTGPTHVSRGEAPGPTEAEPPNEQRESESAHSNKESTPTTTAPTSTSTSTSSTGASTQTEPLNTSVPVTTGSREALEKTGPKAAQGAVSPAVTATPPPH
ncbi:MAG: hypothetical protein WBV77_06550 [Solirubrobacteraceae bacterium]